MKKLVLMLGALVIIGATSPAIVVYDPTNHAANLEIRYQQYLQYLEQAKQYSEQVLQTQNQILQLQNDATNLTKFAGSVLDGEVLQNFEVIDNMMKIHQNSQSAMRNVQNFEANYDKMFNVDRFKNMDSKTLQQEALKISNELQRNSKTSSQLASQAQLEAERIARRQQQTSMLTNGASGNLQAQQALKMNSDAQNALLNQILQLQAEQVRIEGLKTQQAETMAELERENFRKARGATGFKGFNLK